MRLDFGRPDASEYLAMLNSLLIFHTWVAEFSWRTVAGELDQDMAVLIRRKSLQADIQRMSKRIPASAGVARATGHRPEMPVIPHRLRGGREERIGAAYVAAGSVLGGRVIAARLAAGGGGDLPRSFFVADGLDLGRAWRQFQTALDRFGESGADPGRVVSGALAAFALFRGILRVSDASPGAA